MRSQRLVPPEPDTMTEEEKERKRQRRIDRYLERKAGGELVRGE